MSNNKDLTVKSNLKWSDGTIFERSKRKVNEIIKKENKIENKNEMTQNFIPEPQFIFKNTNERDINNDKLASRYMVSQVNSNPFLANNNYINDIEIQENFLKPKNSDNINNEYFIS